MITNIEFSNKEGTHIRTSPSGKTLAFPTDDREVLDWLEGKTQEYKDSLNLFHRYKAIMEYEDKLEQQAEELLACSETGQYSCEYNISPVGLPPSGYYTVKEVEDSILEYNKAVQYNQYTEDEFGGGVTLPSLPTILKTPDELPVIPEPALPKRNYISAYNPDVPQLIDDKVLEIRKTFESDSLRDVEAKGIIWTGGYESAMRLNGKAEMLLHLGIPTGSIHSSDREPHELTIQEIKEVAAAIGYRYEVAFTKYQASRRELELCGEDKSCIVAVT